MWEVSLCGLPYHRTLLTLVTSLLLYARVQRPGDTHLSLKRKEEVAPVSLDRPLGASMLLTQLGYTQTGTEDVGRNSSKQKVSPVIGFPKAGPT